MTLEGNLPLDGRPLARDQAVTPAIDWHISESMDDPAWDAFLTRTPGGHHNQTALWGQVKATVGWRAVRLTARRDGDIVAGAQLLLRPFSLAGAIGFVPKGPLFTRYDPVLAKELLTRLHRLARQQRVRFLLLQPPAGGERLAEDIQQWGFRPSLIRFLPVATTLVDLHPNNQAILAAMRAKTRYNIRLAARKGIVVRTGDAADLPAFYRLLMASAERQGFREYDRAYFERLFAIFEPAGHLRLLLAEYEGEPVATLLLIGFGDTVLYKKGGWSGQESRRHPNELLHWNAMAWAASQGYTAYDFEGIDESNARKLLDGTELTADERDSLTHFKLGFGGAIILNPGPYEYIYNPVLRFLYHRVYGQFRTYPFFKALTHRLLGRGATA